MRFLRLLTWWRRGRAWPCAFGCGHRAINEAALVVHYYIDHAGDRP